ncbi:TetR/AcrR family transcriptional regulator [Leucobacter tenebrionis]|uniref:TetR/AcrR family transcriptional regulator n=1 Tax=Leucobacter tenebrionis TaxID=2873270 RepID=UPI001CA7A736|nr:TetR/AcrR family transcriptional regulator [Leucobacter tenebrionis]QZY50708.1 TetR/AcrR family transcriptional regulator [Leucobacter tenebrionis]
MFSAAPEPAAPGSGSDPAPSARRRETRNRLLDAAAEVFTEAGLQGATVEQVCSRAGFSRGAFYSNFSSKEELFLAALQHQYELRAAQLTRRAEQLIPHLQECNEPLQPAEVAEYVQEFLAPVDAESAWFALETEFMLLAMRDPEIAPPGFAGFLDALKSELAEVVEKLVDAAGRRFILPVERALAVFDGLYDRAARLAALSGGAVSEGSEELGGRITELLFVITEEVE